MRLCLTISMLLLSVVLAGCNDDSSKPATGPTTKTSSVNVVVPRA